ncbi:MAG: hypothetical protein NC111_00485 [Bacteroides sp.]|nr:hypothetical protein [Bacteroides sp.]MCM1414128.1 hypothetical protein [Bacteroides sp.]MCM1470994.1 hypothetical protein [Bacteroides sp.]
MVYRFRLVSDEVDNFRREIDIDADASFLTLRNAICDSVGYDKNQMSSFFLCDDGWEKEKEITLEDMGSDSSEDALIMEECIISDFIEDEGQRLIFVFDYMTDRAFFMELKRSEPGKTLQDPVCSLSMGQAPAQFVDLDEFETAIDTKASNSGLDFDEDFYGSDEYNPEEFDADSYGELSDENL